MVTAAWTCRQRAETRSLGSAPRSRSEVIATLGSAPWSRSKVVATLKRRLQALKREIEAIGEAR